MIGSDLREERLLDDCGVSVIGRVGLIVDQARPHGARFPPLIRFVE